MKLHTELVPPPPGWLVRKQFGRASIPPVDCLTSHSVETVLVCALITDQEDTSVQSILCLVAVRHAASVSAPMLGEIL